MVEVLQIGLVVITSLGAGYLLYEHAAIGVVAEMLNQNSMQHEGTWKTLVMLSPFSHPVSIWSKQQITIINIPWLGGLLLFVHVHVVFCAFSRNYAQRHKKKRNYAHIIA